MGTKVVVFEGLDGTGKSTLIENFTSRLHQEGKTTHTFRQPSGENSVGFLREILKSKIEINRFARQLMHTISHNEDIHRAVDLYHGPDRPDYFVFDRCYLSGIAYGKAMGMDKFEIDLLKKINFTTHNYLCRNLNTTIFFMDGTSKLGDNGDSDVYEDQDRLEVYKAYKDFLNREHVFSDSEKVVLIPPLNTIGIESLETELISIVNKWEYQNAIVTI
jgi:thymidylate kinase